MAIVMNNPDTIDLLLFNPRTTETNWSESNAVADDAEMLNTITVSQGRAKFYGSLHDSIRQVWVELGVPIAFLITATKYCTSTYNVSLF